MGRPRGGGRKATLVRTESQSVFFQTAVVGAAAETEFFGGLAGVAVATGERFFD